MPETEQTVRLDVETHGGGHRIVLHGRWINTTIAVVDAQLRALPASLSAGPIAIDLSNVSEIDTGGAWLIRRLEVALKSTGAQVDLGESRPGVRELILALPERIPEPSFSKQRQPLFQQVFAPIGELTYELWRDVLRSLSILGSAVRGAQLKLGRGSAISPAAVFTQIEQMGVNAVPIIALMSFLIGAIIAQQGAFQLRYFGAEVFVVDLVGILQLREIGVLLTAIMVAGRSGSAITAEIGSMKMHEEIDALNVMGLNPVGVLIFPRLLALVFVLPLLTIIANFAALGGAAVVANVYSGITYEVFLGRLQTAIDLSTVISGMLKAPFMALIIGIVASVEGMKVGGSAESLGRHVTASVVRSIFVVILVDGLFAMFYAAIDF
ncbi:ABC transporter permease [Rhizobium alvei]|uniref:MlaE family lipid ABC transporter permease subunit n=1 Tax=Rhizobium alvei TaxID=1132659 RepID=A0ABT8YK82_9HYPH|nr:MlaE family lipid ABC transporter permease subunit [Rhizobium alvei]MDO6963936.1 MlaE family lipid ABC transporter permease subunit [Rhizobium alvei]